MTRVYIANKRATPLWAVFGAPLIGVPLMVGLLALAAPRGTEPSEVTTSETEVELTIEEAGVQHVGSVGDGSVADVVPSLRHC